MRLLLSGVVVEELLMIVEDGDVDIGEDCLVALQRRKKKKIKKYRSRCKEGKY